MCFWIIFLKSGLWQIVGQLNTTCLASEWRLMGAHPDPLLYSMQSVWKQIYQLLCLIWFGYSDQSNWCIFWNHSFTNLERSLFSIFNILSSLDWQHAALFVKKGFIIWIEHINIIILQQKYWHLFPFSPYSF